MKLLYQQSPLFVYGFSYRLGSLRRDLEQLKNERVLANAVETLAAMGYHYCLSLADNETLLALTAAPAARNVIHWNSRRNPKCGNPTNGTSR